MGEEWPFGELPKGLWITTGDPPSESAKALGSVLIKAGLKPSGASISNWPSGKIKMTVGVNE
jgi:hypothetical protein